MHALRKMEGDLSFSAALKFICEHWFLDTEGKEVFVSLQKKAPWYN